MRKVNQHEIELNKDIKTVQQYKQSFGQFYTVEKREPTLKAKVDAILEHLGLEVEVEPDKNVPEEIVVTVKGKKK